MNNTLLPGDKLRIAFNKQATKHHLDIFADVVMSHDGKLADVYVFAGEEFGCQFGLLVDVTKKMHNSLVKTLAQYGVDQKKIVMRTGEVSPVGELRAVPGL